MANQQDIALIAHLMRRAGFGATRDELEARAAKGEVLTSKDIYFVIAPTMRTSAKKYDWLNAVQCIGKMVSYKNDSYVKYDIFIVR